MVYNTKTFEILHELTEDGMIAYQKMLEEEADMILYNHQHPIKALVRKYILDTKLTDLFSTTSSSK